MANKNKGKSKAKQVEFSNNVEVHLQSPSKRCSKGKEVERQLIGSESDLTELEDSDDEPLGQPSPRRLRSQDREQPSSKDKMDPQATTIPSSKQRRRNTKINQQDTSKSFEGTGGRKLRVPPTRKAKRDIRCLKESDEENIELDELEEEEDEECAGDGGEEEEDAEEEVEVDELVSSASLSPPPEPRARQTPLKKRLRPRRPRKSTPTADEENEGDDEDEEGADDDNHEDGQDDEEEGEGEEEAQEDDEVTIAVEPRKLRNGKIVGEEDVEMDVDDESVNNDDEAEGEGEAEEDEDDEETADDARSVDLGAEGDSDEDENMEEDGMFVKNISGGLSDRGLQLI